jgi:antitoxin component YwqK of YwqJK toxin-antitoxin module
MKNILLVTLLLINCKSFSQDTLTSWDLFIVRVDGLKELICYNGKPFTGVSYGPIDGNGYANFYGDQLGQVLENKTLELRNKRKKYLKEDNYALKTWKNGVLNGLFESYHSNGKIFGKCFYKMGVLDSTYEYYDRLGQLKEKKFYRYNKENGPFEYFHDNGKLSSKGSHKDGLWIGPFESYYSDGSLQEKGTKIMVNKRSLFDGLKVKYFADGKLDEKAYYKAGELNGLYESYFENGQLSLKTTYLNGNSLGLWEEYYQNGTIYEKVTYKLSTNKIDTYMDGLYESYFDNGQLNKRCFYKLGVLNGEYIEYTKDGTLILKVKYINGKNS